MKTNLPTSVRIALTLLIVLVAGLAAGRTAAAQPAEPDAPAATPFTQIAQQEAPVTGQDALVPTNCRYGVGYVPDFRDSLQWIPTLNAGWYVNFNANGFGENVRSAQFTPVIRVRQTIVNGVRQPTYTFKPPLASYYLDDSGNPQKGLGSIIAENPGQMWIVGNEVDVDNFVQDSTMPEVYARAYHEVYTFIKAADPTAKVAIAGLSMMTPGRVQYLDIVWNTYKSLYKQNMPVDVWNMHLYILEERNPYDPKQYADGKIALGTDPALGKLTSFGAAEFCPAPGVDTNQGDPRADVYCRAEHDSVRIFKDQVYNMRNWMKAHGQQDKPLIISEFGLLYPYLGGQPDGSCEFRPDENERCFNPERVTTYLRETIKFLEETTDPALGYPRDGNRLVQQWLWYSIVTEPHWSGGSSNLIVRNYRDYSSGDAGALTMMGQAFVQEAAGRMSTSNLAGGQAGNTSAYLEEGSNQGSAVITASFRNTGNRSVVAPFDVTFYKDQALTQVIGKVTVQPAASGAVTGCSWGDRNSEQVRFVWNNLPAGTHTYWAKIDSGGAIAESSEGDNKTSRGVVVVRPYSAFIPVVGTLR